MTMIKTAQSRRADIQSKAQNMGIDEAFISQLVDDFYRRVRTDRVLSPIFDFYIGEDWDEHLLTMKRFWASVAYNSGEYSGKPKPAHTKLVGVEPSHFAIWLALFEDALNQTTSSQEVVTYFLIRARRIASSLQSAMFCSAEATATP